MLKQTIHVLPNLKVQGHNACEFAVFTLCLSLSLSDYCKIFNQIFLHHATPPSDEKLLLKECSRSLILGHFHLFIMPV